ncbi:hypothetical protein GGI04_000922 [Coemansia thaxteri]|nr:hypothetical protein GGI04_000922 [Coemansia thaxteri]
MKAGGNTAAGAGPRSRRRLPTNGSPAQTTKLLGSADDAGQERTGGGRNGGSTLHIPCKFFKHGNCTAGSDCSFSHNINLFVEKAVCKYYVKGNCKYENKCALLHITSPDAHAATQSRPRPSASSEECSQSESGSSENVQSELGQETAQHKSRSANSNSNSRRTSPPSTLGSRSTLRQNSSSKSTATVAAAAAGSIATSDSESAGARHPLNPWSVESAPSSILRKNQGPPKQLASDAASQAGAALKAGLGPAGFGHASSNNSSTQQQQRNLTHPEDSAFEHSMFGEQDKNGAVSPFRAHFESIQNSAVFDSEMYSRSQPIPKPGAGYSRPGRDGNSSLAPGGGLSMQDSLRIDKLALSHGVNQQSFGGPSFMSGSIPLLDHFGDYNRSDAGFSPGNTPLAHSFARSPPAASSGMMLGRHAFTAVDAGSLALGTPDANMGGGSLRASYHNHLQHSMNPASVRSPPGDGGRSGLFDMSPALNPIGSARSIPRNSDMFSRSLRSSSFANEPASPRAPFGAISDFVESGIHSSLHESPLGSAAGGGISGTTSRLRSNSYIPSPSMIGLSMGLDGGRGGIKNDSGMAVHSSFQDSPFLAREGQLGGYPLTDMHSMSYDRSHAPSGGIWESLNTNLGHEAGRDHDSPRVPFGLPVSSQPYGSTSRVGGSFAQPVGSLGSHYGAGSQNWLHSPRASVQQSVHGSPFVSAVGSFGEHRQLTLPPIGSIPSLSDGLRHGAIGQRTSKSQQLGGDLFLPGAEGLTGNAGQLATAFRGIAPTLATSSTGGNASSGDRSSTASDNFGDVFELEQEIPAPPRANGVAPNPSFISIEGFARKFSGMSLGNSVDSSGGGLPTSAASTGQAIPNVSAITRPSS